MTERSHGPREPNPLDTDIDARRRALVNALKDLATRTGLFPTIQELADEIDLVRSKVETAVGGQGRTADVRRFAGENGVHSAVIVDNQVYWHDGRTGEVQPPSPGTERYSDPVATDITQLSSLELLGLAGKIITELTSRQEGNG